MNNEFNRREFMLNRWEKIRQLGIKKLISEKKKNKVIEKKTTKYDNFINNGDISGIYNKFEKGLKITDSDIIKMNNILEANKGDDRIIIQLAYYDGSKVFRPYLPQYKDIINKIIQKRATITDIEKFGSDYIDEIEINEIIKIKFKYLPPANENGEGQFFNYVNNSNFDLSRYQIYKSVEEFNKSDKEQCFINCLRIYNISESLINKVKLEFNIKNGFFLRSNIKKVCKMLDISIKLTVVDSCNNHKTTIYGKNEKEIKIILFKNHYFVDELTTFKLKDINKNSRSKKPMKSLNLIKKLYNDGYFVKDANMSKMDLKKNDEYFLDDIENEQEEFIFKEKEDKDYKIFWADSESIVRDVPAHVCFLMGVVNDEDDDVKIFERGSDNNKFLTKFLDYIVKKTKKNQYPVVYFHNLKYDYSALLELYHLDKCEKDGNIYSLKLIHEGKIIEFRDSYKYINEPLRDFTSIFGLKDLEKKEALAYEYYTIDNYDNTKVLTSKYIKYLTNDNDIEIFNKALKDNAEIFEYDGKFFNPLAYYKYYLKYDCLVLKHGIISFKETMYHITKTEEHDGLNIYNFLTISAFVDYYIKLNGGFEGFYGVTGNLRKYLSMAINGGRVLVNKKFQKKILKIEGGIQDFDKVSLYPNAIYRFCQEIGFACGRCKNINVLKDLKKIEDFPENVNNFIITIKIKAINKKQQMPFICNRTEEGTIKYVNAIDYEKNLIVDKITLEDYIKFHKIEYDIIEGVFWDGEVNKKFGDLIYDLFEKRKTYKQEMKKYKPDSADYMRCDSFQMFVKLMLNSAYGKTITKKHDIKKVYKSNALYKKFVCKNYNNVESYRPINKNQYEITINSYDESANFSHIGGSILSMSKRIMNEVMSLANDNNIPIYYQDTDSMHLNNNDVPKLAKYYKDVYGKNLIGSNINDFHSDFSFKGHTNIKAVISCFIAPKLYLDVLEGEDINTGKIHKTIHVRIKGISEVGHQVYTGNTIEGYLKLFEKLCEKKEDEKVSIVMNPRTTTVNKVMFGYDKFNRVFTKNTFSREI